MVHNLHPNSVRLKTISKNPRTKKENIKVFHIRIPKPPTSFFCRFATAACDCVSPARHEQAIDTDKIGKWSLNKFKNHGAHLSGAVVVKACGVSSREKNSDTSCVSGWAKIPNRCKMNLGSQQGLLLGWVS